MGAWANEFKVGQLTELRMVCQEVGDYEVARRMPIEVRRWWIEQMQRKDGGQSPEGSVHIDPATGKRMRTQAVR